jgi:hypothetical protein
VSGDLSVTAHNEPVLDLRIYKLLPSKRETFDRILREEALPMLRRYEIDVVGSGPSLADADHYFLARSFTSASRREEQLGSFYGSGEWRREYEQRVMQLIETYLTVVVGLTPSLERVFETADPR